MKKKIFILVSLILIFILTLSISFYIKKNNKYKSNFSFTYNIEDTFNEKSIFSSYIASNLEDNKLISQTLFNYTDTLDRENYVNVFDKETNLVKNEVEEFFGVENSFFNKIKEDKISYSYFIKESSFAYQFDILGNTFGLNSSSESGLFSIIKINYYIDSENYSMSIFDNDGSELIYMHTNSFEDKSYLDLYNEYLDNLCNNNEKLLFGEVENDSAFFPIINIIIDTKINDDIISNYYCGARINISGTGTFLGNNNSLDKSNIKYNFTESSVLFIKRQDCQYPNLIIPCQKK